MTFNIGNKRRWQDDDSWYLIGEISNAIKGCDYVIHLAASLGVANTEKNRLECLHINIQGTINVLEACVKHNIKKIVFASSFTIDRAVAFPIP